MKNSKWEREKRGKWIEDEKLEVNEWKRRGAERDGERRRGEENEKRNMEEAKDRERTDSQSMKQFDNLVILLLQSIRPQRPAIKLDTQ